MFTKTTNKPGCAARDRVSRRKKAPIAAALALALAAAVTIAVVPGALAAETPGGKAVNTSTNTGRSPARKAVGVPRNGITASPQYGWTNTGIPSTETIYDFAYDSTRNVLYACGVETGGNIWRNTNPTGGGAWQSIGAPVGLDATRLAFDESKNVLYAAGDAADVYRCDPSQATPTWVSLGGPGASDWFPCLLLDKANNKLYASSFDGNVYVRSNPAGAGAWTTLPAPPIDMRSLAFNSSGSILFGAGNDGNVYKLSGSPPAWASTGGPGATNPCVWLQMDTGRDILYVSSWDGGVYALPGTTGAGAWKTLGTPSPSTGGVYQIALDPACDILYAGTDDEHAYKNIAPSSGGTTWIDMGAPRSGGHEHVAALELGKDSRTLFAGIGDFNTVGGAFYTGLPSVTGVTPSSAQRGATGIDVVIKCSNTDIKTGAAAHFSSPDIKVNSTTRKSATEVTANIDIADGATLGACDVGLTYTDSGSVEEKAVCLADGFTVEKPTSIWYLAEGTNAWGFSTYITIENPHARGVTARLTYMDPRAESGSGVVARRDVSLPALSQTTVSSMSDIGEVDFSTEVECLEGKKIAVDRTMFWTGPGAASPEGHSSIGTTAPSRTWYLPEGSSEWEFETWTLVQNPGDADASITLTYMTEDQGPIPVKKKIPAHSRATFSMGQDIGKHDASIKIESDVPVIAERSQYRNDRREGSCSIGAAEPSADCYLAEGTTAWGFTTYVLVQNPNRSEVEVDITYMTPDGPWAQPSFKMPANSRKTVRVNDLGPVASTDLSIHVHGSKPIVAERAMYWDNGTGEACHASIGLPSPAMTFLLPDGQTSEGRETWTLVQNPNGTPVQVTLTYLRAGGGKPVVKTETIGANSRKTFNMAEHSGIEGRASVVVAAKPGTRPIMAERAMYWNGRGAGIGTIGGRSE